MDYLAGNVQLVIAIFAFNRVFISNIQLWCYNEGVENLWYADCIVI